MEKEMLVKFTLSNKDILKIAKLYINPDLNCYCEVGKKSVIFKTKPFCEETAVTATVPIWHIPYDYIRVTETNILNESVEGASCGIKGEIVFYGRELTAEEIKQYRLHQKGEKNGKS